MGSSRANGQLMQGQASSPILDLCVVVLNYNGGTLLARAVDAAARQSELTCAIVVVDNASTDGSFDALIARLGVAEPSQDGTQVGGPPDGRGDRYLLLRAGQNRATRRGTTWGSSGSRPAISCC